ncbi:MAG: putative DNA-binding domain-containing protein [Gammaproteobacteria bacterium]|nr:putative DNA-binding domain-containing protein [Gammaproteobacteria bacterium]
MPERPEFQKQQLAFAAHIRNPEKNPAPEAIEDRRMGIYRELFFNNVAGFLSNGFPILKKLYSEEQWEKLARDFFERHHCHTPLFLGISREFLDYLQNEHEPQPEDPPFLLELAHYEWVELALSIDENEIPENGFDSSGNLLEGRPLLSPLAWPLSYSWPVHRISPEFRPETEEETHLLVYRNSKDEVGFIELNPVTARLLGLLVEHPDSTGRELLEQIAGELNHPEPEVVIQGGSEILQELHAQDIILGTH